MVENIFFVLTLVGLVGAIVAFVVGVVFITGKRWLAALVTAVVMVLCGAIGVGGAVGLTVHGRGHKVYRGLRETRMNDIKEMTPEVDYSKVNDQFWDYDGDRDWWRVPVRYPYDLQFIDELKRGELCRNIANGRSENGNRDNESEVSDLTHFAVDSQMLVYRREEWRGHSVEFGIFLFDKGTNEKYATEAEAWKAAAKAGWVKAGILESVENYHHWYWGY